MSNEYTRYSYSSLRAIIVFVFGSNLTFGSGFGFKWLFEFGGVWAYVYGVGSVSVTYLSVRLQLCCIRCTNCKKIFLRNDLNIDPWEKIFC